MIKMEDLTKEAAQLIKNSKHTVAFTGAGISVESGIPPFRGQGGIWNKYDPKILELDYFLNNAAEVWPDVRKMLYEDFKGAKPNDAHKFLAFLEKNKFLEAVITQNIDNLHTEAGNTNVIEFHGNLANFVCTKCGHKQSSGETNLYEEFPKCNSCGSLTKPDVVFFGEAIPQDAYAKSVEYAEKSDLMLIIGTSGVVYPAAFIPQLAKQAGAKIIEINLDPSEYTNSLTDIFLQGRASEICNAVKENLLNL